MRKYFVHYMCGRDNVRAIVKAPSPGGVKTQIRKLHKKVVFFSITDIAQMDETALASRVSDAGAEAEFFSPCESTNVERV